MKIQINQQYKNVVSVTKEDYTVLKQSIKENGLLQPIVINQNGTILDGHLRYQVCNELGIEPKFLTKQFDNILEEKRYVILSNLSRRHLNNYQKAKLGFLLEPIERELAKLRQGTRTDLQHYGNSTVKLESREAIGNQIGISGSTYEHAKYVMEHGSKELQDDCESGNVSVNSAYTKLKHQTKEYKESQIKSKHKREIEALNLAGEFLSYNDLSKLKILIFNFLNELTNISKNMLSQNLHLASKEIDEVAAEINILFNLLNNLEESIND
jgi:hypothetical protein